MVNDSTKKGDKYKVKRIRALRERRGISQSRAAKQMGIVRTTYSNYEAGNREPDLETIKKIAEFFEVSVDYLLERDESFLTDPQKIELYNLIDELDDDAKNYVMETIKRITKK